MKLNELKLHDRNPRKISPEQLDKLVKSITDLSQMMELRPIVIDENNIILGGNMRYRALKKMGYKEIPDNWVKRADNLTEEQKREFIVKDNVGFGDWEIDILQEDYSMSELTEWGLDLKFEEFKEDDAEAEEDDFSMPEEVTTDICIGDIFQIGNHKLICGDSTKKETYEKLMGSELADMMVTDPPYNVSYEGKTKEKLKIQNDSMSSEQFYNFLFDFYSESCQVIKKGGAAYIWHASSEIVNFAKAFADAGFEYKQYLIWVKNSIVLGRQDYQWKHEPCLYGWRSGGSHKWYADRKQSTVINFDKPARNGEHPTMKPVGLFGYQIGNSSKTDDIVIDPFGGSGTTMVACEQMGRRARLVEYDPKYCQVIIDRMKKLNPDISIEKLQL